MPCLQYKKIPKNNIFFLAKARIQEEELFRGLLDERVDGPPDVRREEYEYHADVAQYHQRRGHRADHYRCTHISQPRNKHTRTTQAPTTPNATPNQTWQGAITRGHAFDAAEEEGGAEGEDHVRDAQRVLHRRDGLRVVGRHPRLHRVHRSIVAGDGRPPRLASITYTHSRPAAARNRNRSTSTSARIKQQLQRQQLSAAFAGRRAQGEDRERERERARPRFRGNLRPVEAERKIQRLA